MTAPTDAIKMLASPRAAAAALALLGAFALSGLAWSPGFSLAVFESAAFKFAAAFAAASLLALLWLWRARAWSLARLGAWLLHFSLVVALAAAAGLWRQGTLSGLEIREGQALDLPGGGILSLERLLPAYAPGGWNKGPAADLKLAAAGRPTVSGLAFVNHPFSQGSREVQMVDYGLALELRLGSADKPGWRGFVHLNPPKDAQGSHSARFEWGELFFKASGPRGLGGRLRLRLAGPGGDVIFDRVLARHQRLEQGGLSASFDDLRYWARLRVVSRPWAGLLLGALWLGIAGAAMALLERCLNARD